MSGEWLSARDVMFKYRLLDYELIELCLQKILTPYINSLPIEDITYSGGRFIQAKFDINGHKGPHPVTIDELVFKKVEVETRAKTQFQVSEDNNAAVQGRWISGAEVMRIYNLHPKELGELCLQGTLTPYHDESLEPVREGAYFHNTRFYFTFPEFYKKNKPEMPPRGPDPHSFPVWQKLLARLLFRHEELSEVFPSPAGPQAATEPGTAEAEAAQPGEAMIDDAEKNARKWEELAKSLNGKERNAARIAAWKWRGRSHADAYKAAIGGTIKNPTPYVSGLADVARSLAADHGLAMPRWQT